MAGQPFQSISRGNFQKSQIWAKNSKIIIVGETNQANFIRKKRTARDQGA
jgi:hypothetical protein